MPIGLPSLNIRRSFTSLFKSSALFIPGNLEGLMTSFPRGLFLIFAISGVTFSPGRWPPIPGLVPCPILISMALEVFRFSSVTLYKFGTYSKIYLCAASFSSGRMPPSPLHMAVPAAALPLASAIFVSLESAPKDICEM